MKRSTTVDSANTLLRSPERQIEIVRSAKKSGLSTVVASVIASSLAVAAEPNPGDPAHTQWRDTMIRMDTPHEGCFQATFPSTLWERVPCRTISKHAHPEHRRANSVQAQAAGNGNDYALVASAGDPITQTVGSFPLVSAVESESSVGGDGGILGVNEYTLQINTNDHASTSACSGGAAGCTVWQQFIYATDYETQGSAAVFMQYWLLGFGASCPSGYWSSPPVDCYKNSNYVSVPDVPIPDLGNLKLTGTAVKSGNDTVTFANGTQAYSVSAPDSVLQIGTVWEQSEFNVVGDCGLSEAVFNPGAAITVNVAANFGSTAAPQCPSGAGTTGETNNLVLGSCVTAGGTMPSIQFAESYDVVPIGSPIGATTQGAGRYPYDFVTGTDGNLWVNYWLGSDWTWVNLEKPSTAGINGAVGVIDVVGDDPYVFVTGTDGNLWVDYWPGHDPWQWVNLGKPSAAGINGAVGAITQGSGAYPYAFVTGTDGNLWVDYSVGSTWQWVNLGKPSTAGINGAVGVIDVVGDDPYVFVTGTDGNLWVDYWLGHDPWQWVNLGKPSSAGITGAVGVIDIDGEYPYEFVTGTDGNIWVNYWLGSNWQWVSVGHP